MRASPFAPHAMGYVTDISPRDELPAVQTRFMAFGFYFGVYVGFVGALMTFVIAGGPGENQENGFTGTFIPWCFSIAIAVISVGLAYTYRMEESIPPKKRRKSCGWDALPFVGLFSYGLQNKYLMSVIGYLFWFSFGVGANEAIAFTLFQRWFLSQYGQFTTLLIGSAMLSRLPALFRRSRVPDYCIRLRFKVFHLIFPGFPTSSSCYSPWRKTRPPLAGLQCL